MFLTLGTRFETVYLRHAPIKPPAPIKKSFPRPGKENIFLFLPAWKGLYYTPTHKHASQGKKHVGAEITQSRDKGHGERLDCKRRKRCKCSHKSGPESKLSFWTYKPDILRVVHYQAEHKTSEYIHRKGTPRCTSMSSQNKNRQIAPRNPPAPMRKILSGSLYVEDIVFFTLRIAYKFRL